MKRCFLIVLICAALLLGALYFLPPEAFGLKTPVVLMYHLFEEEPFTELEYLFTAPDDFEAQLAMLKDEGYEFLFASEYARTVKEKSVIITVDDGYADNYTVMLPLLEKYGAKATVFVVSGNVDRTNFLTEEQLKAMAESEYIEIGSHTRSHAILNQMDIGGAAEEMRLSKADLEALTGKPVTTFSFPQGATSRYVAAKVKKFYSAAFTTNPFRPGLFTNRYAIPRIGVDRGVSAEELLKRISK